MRACHALSAPTFVLKPIKALGGGGAGEWGGFGYGGGGRT